MLKQTAVVAALALLTTGVAGAETVMMSADWAAGMCAAWNAEPGLTENLGAWMDNDADRGHKLLRVYRRDCPDSPQIQLKTARTDDGVVCVESGWATDEELTGADYTMFADTGRWLEMGAGKYGPMGGMMTGRLKFQGPRWEAMKNMGPFKNFLLLVGKVPGTTDDCPSPSVEPSPAEELPGEQVQQQQPAG